MACVQQGSCPHVSLPNGDLSYSSGNSQPLPSQPLVSLAPRPFEARLWKSRGSEISEVQVVDLGSVFVSLTTG